MKLRACQALIENLEARCLLTVYNSQAVPLLTLTEGTTATNFTVATFATNSPVANLSAQVFWAPGIAAPNPGATTINPTGQVFVPGIGLTNQYTVTVNSATLGASTGTFQPQFSVNIHDTTDNTTALAVGTIQVTEYPITYNNGFVTPGTTEGSPVTVDVAEFFDGSPSPSTNDYAGTVDFSDGTGPQALTFTTVGGGFVIASATHTFAEAGSYPYSFSLSDTAFGGATISGTSSNPVPAGPVVVTDGAISNSGQPAIPINATEGQHLSNIALGSFLDSNPNATPDDFTGFINWGDGTPVDVAAFTRVGMIGGSSLWLVTGNHTFQTAAGGPFSVSVGITDRDSGVVFPAAQLTLTATATVVQTPLAVMVPGLNASAATSVPSGTVVGTFSDNAGADPIASYSASFNWGDGTTFTTGGGTLTIVPGVNANTFNVVTAAAHTYVTPGLYPTTLTANDSDPAIGIGNGFALVAAAAIAPTPAVVIGPFAATEGLPLPASTTVASFTIANPAAVAGDFHAVIDWGDGSPTSFGTIVPNGVTPTSATFLVQGGHTYAETGSYTITVLFSDNFGTTVTATTSATVADGALSNGTAINIVGTEDQPLNSVPVAVFVDANPNATPADITATIDWGDGSPVVPGVVTKIGSTPGGSSIFQVSGTHTYASSVGSPYTLTVNIGDEDTPPVTGGVPQIALNPSATITEGAIDVTVLPVTATPGAPTGAGVAGVPTPDNELIATFTDSTGADALANYSATVNWGDGTTPDTTPNLPGSGTVTILALGGGQFGVYGTHTYATAGLFRITVTVNDSDPAVGVGANLAYVFPPAIIATATPVLGVLPPGTEGQPLPPTPGLPVGVTGTELATLTVSVPGQPVSNYSAQIDWGDGSPQSAGQIVPDLVADAADPTRSHFIVVGTHTYLEARTSPYDITVFITQSLPSAGSFFDTDTTVHVTDSVTIDDALLTPGIAAPIFGTENQPLNGVLVGTFTDANPFATAADFSATINWGDGSLPAADPNTEIRLISGTPAGAVFGVYGSHLYKSLGANNGLFSTTVTVVDEDGPVGASIVVPPVAANNVTISQSPILVTVLPLRAIINQPAAQGAVVATFVDVAGADGDLLTDYSATIDWGDGTPTDTGTIVDLGGGQFSVSAPAGGHTYTTIGTFVLKVSVHDSDPADGVGAALAVVQNSVIAVTPVAGPILNPATSDLFNEGEPLVNLPLATLTDTDTSALPGDYTVQIDWGDGAPQSQGTIVADPVADAADPTHAHFIIQGSHTYAEANLAGYTVQLIVTNAFGSKASTSLAIVVADAPLSTALGLPIFATEFQPLNNIPVATFVDANPLGSAGDFSATIDWGDGSPLDANARIVLVGANPGGPGVQYAVYGSHVYTTVTPPGSPFLAAITIQDEDGSTIATTPGSVTVGVNASPLVISPTPVTTVENVPLPNGQTIPAPNGPNPPTIVATFYDTAGPDALSAYSALIDWGNGTASTPDTVTAATILQNGTNFVILAPAGASVAYPEEGTYTIRIALLDANGGATAYAIDTVSVADGKLTPAAPQPVIPAQTQGVPSGQIPIVSFNDQNPLAPAGEFSATIDWGDGSPQSAGLISQPGVPGTAFVVSGNHTYAQPSTGAGYSVVVHIVDEGGASVTLTTSLVVSASVITVTPATFNAVEGQPVSNVVVATFADSGVPGPISSYAASINWADGTPATVTPGQIVPLGGNQFEVLGSLINGYSEEGTFNVLVTVTHNGATVTGSPFSATAKVADAPLQGTVVPITATEGTAFTGPIANFTDLDPNGAPSDYTVTINWGDGTAPVTLPGTSVITQPAGPGTPFVVSVGAPGHLYTEEGTDTLTVTVTDHNATFTATEEVTVKDAAPVPVNPQPIVTVNEGALFSGPVATFREVAGTFAEDASDFTATVDWGDGSPASTGVIVATGTPGVFQVVGSHLYANLGNHIGGTAANPSGTFNILVTIHDDGGTTLVITNPATVNEVPIVVTGQIDRASDSGKSSNDGVTNVNEPTFFGTTEPFAHVKLFATSTGVGALFLIGQTEALSDGSWRIISNHLADGSYTITAMGQDQAGLPVAPGVFPITVATNGGPNVLTIDTVGPRLTDATFDRATDTATFTFEDVNQDTTSGGSGLLVQSLQDAANYALQQLVKVHGHLTTRPLVVTSLIVSPGATAGSEDVTLVFNNGAPLGGGRFQLTARAASAILPSGVQDVAGNALDGEYYGQGSATGNGVPGGNFVAQFTLIHNGNTGPQTIIGIPHPNDPAGHFHKPLTRHHAPRATPARHPVVRTIARHHR